MSTQLFFHVDSSNSGTDECFGNRGNNDAKLDGTTTLGWNPCDLSTVRGNGVVSTAVNTVNGATAGVEFPHPLTSSSPMEFISPPLSVAATISGTITFNLRASENSMSANAAVNCYIDRLDNTGAIVGSRVVKTAFTTELGTSESANNFTAAPTSTNFAVGDRIRAVVFIDDAGTMATGFSCSFFFNGTASAASGDSFITFTENLSFMSTSPAGTKLILTNTNSAIADQGASVDEKEMWTSQGSSVTDAVRNTTNGWTAPLQWTTSAGGNTIEWYSRPLTAFTLSNLVKCQLRALESSLSANCNMNAELAVVNDDGSGASVYGSGGIQYSPGNIKTTETQEIIWIGGPNISVTNGQRLRLRVRIDDDNSAQSTGFTATLKHNGSAGATGDSFITLAQSVTEFVAAANPAYRNNMPQLLAQ